MLLEVSCGGVKLERLNCSGANDESVEMGGEN